MIRRVLRLLPGSGARLPWKGAGNPDLDDAPLVLHHGALPTLYHYFLTRVPSVRLVDTRTRRPDAAVFRDARRVVVVRHAAPDWLRFLARQAPSCRVDLFLDDDLPAILEDPHLPRRYALRSWMRFRALSRKLRGLDCGLLAATPALAQRCGISRECVLPPLPPVRDLPEAPSQGEDRCVIFYHGTASHMRELRWLRDVLARVLEALPHVLVEVFGPAEVNRAWRGMERVRVVHPMPWPAYLAYTRTAALQVGLAPLLDSPFNAARSWVKFIDIARAGAVGVFADSPVFAPLVRHGENGLVAGPDPDAWVEAVCRLAGDADLRHRLAAAALETARAHSGELA